MLYPTVQEGVRGNAWMINQLPVVVSSSSCNYALHFVWILWRIIFVATSETLFARFRYTFCVCEVSDSIVMAWRGTQT